MAKTRKAKRKLDGVRRVFVPTPKTPGDEKKAKRKKGRKKLDGVRRVFVPPPDDLGDEKKQRQRKKGAKKKKTDAPPSGLGPLAARYALTKREIKTTEDQLKELQERLQGIAETLLTEFERHGVKSLTAHGTTIYLFHDTFINKSKEATDEEATAALEEAGLAAFVHAKINRADLRAWMKEQDVDEETGLPVLPPEIARAFTLSEKYEIRARSSK